MDNAKETLPPLIDLVCGMTVTPQSPHVLQHKGLAIYFCSASCQSKFSDNPDKYSTLANG